jgi:diadenosine tetraphosphate (Ap4A) HIT family hydrolase
VQDILWKNESFFIQKHSSNLPWIKLFTNSKYKEITELPYDLKMQMYALLEIIEKTMIEFYNPEKINVASFGNMLPHLHWHIIARFKDDPYFPKTTWEEPIREFTLNLPEFEDFTKILNKNLKEI